MYRSRHLNLKERMNKRMNKIWSCYRSNFVIVLSILIYSSFFSKGEEIVKLDKWNMQVVNQSGERITRDGITWVLAPWYAVDDVKYNEMYGLKSIRGARFTPELADVLEADDIIERKIRDKYIETMGRIPSCVDHLKEWNRYCIGYRNEKNERVIIICYSSRNEPALMDELNRYLAPDGILTEDVDSKIEGMFGISVQVNLVTKEIVNIKHEG